jgi:hypothetical protein
MWCSKGQVAVDAHTVKAAAQHMVDSPGTLADAGTKVYLAGHVAVETVLTLEKRIEECDNFPHWEVDNDS